MVPVVEAAQAVVALEVVFSFNVKLSGANRGTLLWVFRVKDRVIVRLDMGS